MFMNMHSNELSPPVLAIFVDFCRRFPVEFLSWSITRLSAQSRKQHQHIVRMSDEYFPEL
jgi:hypothetical protein